MRDFFKNLSENKLKVSASLILISLLVYYKSLFYSFSPLDEQWLIVNNTDFLEKWDSLFNAFKSSIQKIYYRPLLQWSFIIDYHLGGLDPFTYHLTNLVLHGIAVLLLHRFLLLLDVEKRTSHLLALIFAVHPLLAHAVAWIPGRNDVLLTLFALSAGICLVHFIKSGKALYALLHLVFFALSFFTKETGIILPLLFLAVYLVHKPFDSRLLILAVFWIAGVFTWFALRNTAIQPLPFAPKNYWLCIMDTVKAIVVFSGKSIFPFFQSVSPTPGNSYVILNLALLVLFLIVAWVAGIKNKKNAGLGLLTFFAGIALPAWFGALTPLGEQYEHRAYLPLTGMILFISQINFNIHSRIVFNSFIALIFVFACKTFFREATYKDELSYLEEGIEDCPGNYIFQTQMGNFLYLKKEFSAALPFVNKAIEMQPAKAQLFNSRGNIYFELNKKNEAIADYTRALKLSNNNPSVYLARCMAFKKFKDAENARIDMLNIKKLYPGVVSPVVEKEIMEAWFSARLSAINDLIRKEPAKAALYVNRAKLFFDKRMGREALADLKKATELEPQNKEFKSYYDKLNSTFPY